MYALEEKDPFIPSLGCGFNDWVCYGQEGVARLIGEFCRALGNFIGDMISNAFLGAQASKGDWAIAEGHFWFWVALAAVMVITIGLWQVGVAVVLQQPGRVPQIVGGMIAGVFLSTIALQVMPQLVESMSGITAQLTAGLNGNGGIGAAILNVLGLGGGANGIGSYVFTSQSAFTALATSMTGGGSTVIASLLLALVALGVISIAALLLFIAMSIRTFALIALVAFAPLGLMFYGQPRMKDMAEKWAQLALGLLLAEPLAAGILLLATNLAAGTTASSMGLLLVSAGAIFASAFSPLWAVKLVSFAGGELQTAMGNSQWGQQQSRSAGRSAGRAAGRLAGRFAR